MYAYSIRVFFGCRQICDHVQYVFRIEGICNYGYAYVNIHKLVCTNISVNMYIDHFMHCQYTRFYVQASNDLCAHVYQR